MCLTPNHNEHKDIKMTFENWLATAFWFVVIGLVFEALFPQPPRRRRK